MPRENPAVSIIVPVYNLEKLLPRCLASIAAQTTPDWECVLVDDGSADGSLAVCRQWAEQDARFRVLHQENQGVSAARNAGIQAARAPYFLPVLSFNLRGMESEAVGERLGQAGIAVRCGLHCAPLAHQKLGTQQGTVRVSPSAFTRREEIDALARQVGRLCREKV